MVVTELPVISFHRKTLLVTGANGAIGRATAALFHQLGANLVLSDLKKDALNDFAKSLDPDRSSVLVLCQDAGNPAHAEAVVESAMMTYGALDCLVTAAGFLQRESIVRMSDEQMNEMFAVNFRGVFATCRAASRVMRPGSAMVNVASLAAHTGRERSSHYSAAKGAVLAFTKSLAAELAPEIRVNAVSPGFVETPLAKTAVAAQGEDLLSRIPMGRLGTPSEVAHAIAFLCSDAAAYITGQTLHVNGGLYISG